MQCKKAVVSINYKCRIHLPMPNTSTVAVSYVVIFIEHLINSYSGTRARGRILTKQGVSQLKGACPKENYVSQGRYQ